MDKDEIIALLKKVSFENDQMEVLSFCRKGREIELPLSEGPINFSVMSPTGFSIRRGVTVESKGDAYIYNRDITDAEKVSLHSSGDQQIAIKYETAIRLGTNDRFGPKWIEPEFGPDAVPTFNILFPPWGVMNRHPKDFAKKKDELVIVGHVDKIVVVGFIIMDSHRELRAKPGTSFIVLGRLSLRPGKVLHIVAWKEPDNGLKERLSDSLKHVQAPVLPKKTDDLSVCFQGFRSENSAFMVEVPVTLKAPN